NFDYSDAPFPEVFGHDTFAAPDYMGDYDQATSDNHYFYTSFVDTRRGNQDVFFEKIPVNGPTAASRTPWLVVHGSPDDDAEMAPTPHDVRGSSVPTSLANRDALFANLGQFLAPNSSATDAPGLPPSFSVTARDAFGNVNAGSRGTVHLSSTDPTGGTQN